MTDFTAGTDLCFTESKLASPHLTFCCFVCAHWVRIPSWRHSSQLGEHGDITPSLGCCGCSVPAEGCPAQPRGTEGQSPCARRCCGSHRARGTGHPVPLASSLPGVYTPEFSSCIYCLPKWELLDPGPSLLLPDKGTQLRGAPQHGPLTPTALSHSSSLPCGRASPKPLLLPLHCQHHMNSPETGV